MSGIDEDELSRALHARLDAISVPLRGLEDIRHRAGVRRRRRTALSSVAAAVVLVGVGATGVRLFGVQNTPQDPATATAVTRTGTAGPLPSDPGPTSGSTSGPAPISDAATTSSRPSAVRSSTRPSPPADSGPAFVPPASPLSTVKPACVNGVQVSGTHRLEANGIHRASFELLPCGQGNKPAPLEAYPKLVLRTASGQTVTVPVTHSDSAMTPEQLTTAIPVCMVLAWPDKSVGTPVNVATVTVSATAKHPAYTLAVPMTLGSTSGVDQGHWVANSGSCLGVG